MSTTITEGNLQFDFGDSWTVMKYDGTGGYYRTKVQTHLEGTKAVDFLGLQGSRPLVLLEVKDFRVGVPGNVKMKGLTKRVAEKARDTLAGILGGAHCSSPGEKSKFSRFLRVASSAGHPPRIIFLFEDLATPRRQDPRKSKQKRDTLLKELKKMCGWITRDVAVVGLDDYADCLKGLTVRNR